MNGLAPLLLVAVCLAFATLPGTKGCLGSSGCGRSRTNGGGNNGDPWWKGSGRSGGGSGTVLKGNGLTRNGGNNPWWRSSQNGGSGGSGTVFSGNNQGRKGVNNNDLGWHGRSPSWRTSGRKSGGGGGGYGPTFRKGSWRNGNTRDPWISNRNPGNADGGRKGGSQIDPWISPINPGNGGKGLSSCNPLNHPSYSNCGGEMLQGAQRFFSAACSSEGGTEYREHLKSCVMNQIKIHGGGCRGLSSIRGTLMDQNPGINCMYSGQLLCRDGNVQNLQSWVKKMPGGGQYGDFSTGLSKAFEKVRGYC